MDMNIFQQKNILSKLINYVSNHKSKKKSLGIPSDFNYNKLCKKVNICGDNIIIKTILQKVKSIFNTKFFSFISNVNNVKIIIAKIIADKLNEIDIFYNLLLNK